jgi:hypothetical protein
VRTLAPLLVVVLLAGCAARRHAPAEGGQRRAAVLARPGDAARTSILGLEHGPRPTSTSADPLPALARSELNTGPLEPAWTLGAGAYVPRAPYRSPLLGRWRLAGDGDVAMPLEGAWRVRVGLSAGGSPPERDFAEPGRRSETYMVPGLRLERDL